MNEFTVGVQFTNLWGLNNECKNMPITKNGNCVGFIEYVDKDFIYGTFFNYRDINGYNIVAHNSTEFVLK